MIELAVSAAVLVLAGFGSYRLNRWLREREG